jgi:predicted NBD/HSP70 family sugar kinase
MVVRHRSPHASEVIRGHRARNVSGTNLKRAGDHNQRVTLHAIRVSGPVTRADLARMTGLTAAAIANITKRLLKERMILEAGTMRGMRGQPATKLAINPDSCYSVGLNVDRDHISLVVVDFAGRVRARISREVMFALPDEVQRFVRRSVGRLLAKADIDPADVIGMGVAFPDDIQRPGLPDQPADYAQWGAVAVDQLLAGILPGPILVENDAAAAAMGEMQFGLGQQYQSFFYVLITAALGGGLVIDGQYFRGAKGRSGELGWLRRREASGQERQLQNIISLSALESQLAAAGFPVNAPRALTQLDQGARAVIDAWIENSAEALEECLISINCLINPEAVLIGGRLPAVLVDRLAERLNQRLRPQEGRIPSVAPIRRAAMSDDAPAVGAAILPFSARFLPTRLALMKTAYEPTIPASTLEGWRMARE